MSEQLILLDGCEVEPVTAAPPSMLPCEQIVRAWWPQGRYWSIKVPTVGQAADGIAERLLSRGWRYVHLITLPHDSKTLEKIIIAEVTT